MYIYTLALAQLRDALSASCVIVTNWYLSTNKTLAANVQRDAANIQAKRDAKITATKQAVVRAAETLIALERTAQEDIDKYTKQADEKIFKLKLKTKVA